ncbi:MAG: NUDIX domain-containing protein [bacterium]|nr:NUDIX domain-containing protein [bacterium]
MIENRFKAMVSVHLLFLKDEEILLLLRKNITSDGLYSVVAGHIDGGETVTNAMIREAKEEVGVEVKLKDIEIRTVSHSYSRHNNKEFIQFYAVCEKWQGEIKNNEPDKCGELRFFSLNDLPDNIVPYIRVGIKKTIDSVNFYEYGWKEGEE